MSIKSDAAHLAQLKLATAGLDHLADMKLATAGFDHLADMKLATAGLDHLADMKLATAGLDHLADMKLATAGFDHLADMKLATAGLDHLADMKLATAGLHGLSEQMKAALGPSLIANEIASLRLSDQLKAMDLPSSRIADQMREALGPTAYVAEEIRNLRGSLAEQIGAAKLATERSLSLDELTFAHDQGPSDDRLVALEIPRFDMPAMPANPIHETNGRLAELSEHISQMRDLAATTAQMQQSLNEVAKTILTEFSKGAEASNRATKRALWIAAISTALSLVAVVVAVWSVLHQDAQNSKRENEAEAERAVQLEVQHRNTTALNRLSKNLEAERTTALAGRAPVTEPRPKLKNPGPLSN
ncbi:hypothetical protein [Phenylobacterium sp.]|uniref:hypothetical protein n=1 Tax=Phenylobacterium sp. TaxID=1871053 RepID=UPI002F421085